MKNIWPARPHIPLVLQILALLFFGLIVAQVVTLLLSSLLPQSPVKRHDLAAIAAALRGVDVAKNDLDRTVQKGPPDVSGAGWVPSASARNDLARVLNVPVQNVGVAYYTPLPFAGTASNRPARETSQRGDILNFHLVAPAFAQAPPPPPPQGSGAFPGANLPPNGGSPREPRPPSGDAGPAAPNRRGGGLFDVAPSPPNQSSKSIPGDGGETVPPIFGPRPSPQAASVNGPLTRENLDPITPSQIPERLPSVQPVPQPAARSVPKPSLPITSELQQAATGTGNAPSTASPSAAPAPPQQGSADTGAQTGVTASVFPEKSVPIPTREPGLFGLAAPAYVEGDFVAALRTAPGQWVVVQPLPEAFPNSWQRRVLLWFALSFLLVIPVGWLFARRIVKPLTAFASAADKLGRDPSSLVIGIGGPAEVGRAAHAFNLMQNRLKSFVDDRTAMVGAISHDLRTPLTRLRFRIEEVDDDVSRDGMVMEVEEMEDMINSVLTFIRDASTPGIRDRVDLRTILSDVVQSNVRTGTRVKLEGAQAATVDADPLGMRRVFGNLIDNAVKYGGSARVRLVVKDDLVWTDIVDDGPGIPDDEIERAFEPFYRSSDPGASTQKGHGLGLAVCRSIARSHGGDVRFLRQEDGFTARFQLPLAFAA